jgi:hypothetical protein
MDTGEDLNQGRLACAVVSKQSQDLTWLHVHVDPTQRMNPAEGLGDFLEFKKGRK